MFGYVHDSKTVGSEVEYHCVQFFQKQYLLKKVSFVRKDKQTDRQTDGQTDKHPQTCSENKPFGKPLVASRQKYQNNLGFFFF